MRMWGRTHCFDEVLQAELDCQGRLAYSSVTQHHQLVQHHLPRHLEGIAMIAGVFLEVECVSGQGQASGSR